MVRTQKHTKQKAFCHHKSASNAAKLTAVDPLEDEHAEKPNSKSVSSPPSTSSGSAGHAHREKSADKPNSSGAVRRRSHTPTTKAALTGAARFSNSSTRQVGTFSSATQSSSVAVFKHHRHWYSSSPFSTRLATTSAR